MKTSVRTRARRLAVQGLYEWQITGNDAAAILNQFLNEKDMKNVDVKYFTELLSEIPAHRDELDEYINPHLNRGMDELDLVEHAILRLGAYELAHHIDIPYRVVINEAVELAKMFGADQGHKFVNGIMDKMSVELRSIEVNAAGRKQ